MSTVNFYCMVAVSAVMMTAAGCSLPVPAHDAPGVVPGPSAALGMMRPQDRERIAALTAERARKPATDGYRIGPDDELRITIPNLVTPNSPLATYRPTVPGPTPVNGAPLGEGTRVSAGGRPTSATASIATV